jgi:murein DD-endopeptidase MepM/ murein hydrolase activator NlpD
VNPLAKIANLDPARIDEGVDYGGSGPLLALGSGVIRQTAGPGWPGGTFIALALDKGPFAGRIVYYAENITPMVSPGQHVSAGDVVGTLKPGFPHLEIGWGGGGVGGGRVGDALARTNGGDVDGVSSALGIDFNAVLMFLGAPSGIQQGLMGRLPSGWSIPAH